MKELLFVCLLVRNLKTPAPMTSKRVGGFGGAFLIGFTFGFLGFFDGERLILFHFFSLLPLAEKHDFPRNPHLG